MLLTNSNGINLKYSELVDALLSYQNLHIRYLNPVEFSKGTKLENFFQRNAMENSTHPLEHTADIMRVLILNKYGGQYLDLDIFSLMLLSTTEKQNFACTDSENMVANGITNMDNDDENFSEMLSNWVWRLDINFSRWRKEFCSSKNYQQWYLLFQFLDTTFKYKFGAGSAYVHLAKIYCPKIHKMVDKYF